VTADEGQDGERRPIPAETWAELVEMLPIDDVLDVGFTALKFRNFASAGASVTVALRKAVASGVLTQMPEMALMVGAMLQRRDPDCARAAFQQAIDSGDANVVPNAYVSLGELLWRRGDIDGAQAAFQQAIDSGDANVVPNAYVMLGHLLRRQGDIDGARAAYQQAIDSGDDIYAPIEIARLGELSKRHGHVDSSGARDVGGDS
jgi:tetratricopeptide (TPR) repeat protein